MLNKGVHDYGAYLAIDRTNPVFDHSLPFVIDVETDERDNFVGIGITQDGKTVYYFSDLGTIRTLFSNKINLIGHNLKFDLKLLHNWGIEIPIGNIFADTMLMSYVINSTKESHGLKELGKELGYEWSTYKEIVGKGKAKCTLDKQPLGLVANYCAMDVLVTYNLYQHYKKQMDVFQTRVLNTIELPLMRVLYEMEIQGVLIDTDKLTKLDTQFKEKLDVLKLSMVLVAGKDFNPNSNKQTAKILESRGLLLPTTPKGNKKVDKFVLEQYAEDALVALLQTYNSTEKLWSTYTQGMLKLTTLPKVYTTYNQISRDVSNDTWKGISTGRLSSSKPNLQQIPTRTEEGKLIRELFIPREGYTLIDADYSQIEPRIVAHFSKDPFLTNVYRTGADIYESLVEGTGRDRSDGKTFMLALLYGAGVKKLARNFKCSVSEAQVILDRINAKIPGVVAWVNRIKYEAKQKGGVYTLHKRWIPLPGIQSADLYDRFHWERAAVNYIIQGSAAEVIKLAMIELRKKGYLPILTVHDELLFEDTELEATHNRLGVKHIMESVVKLDVPLIATVGTGKNWREAKDD